MLTRLAGGRVIDPAHGRDGVGDVWIRDGRIVEPPPGGAHADATPRRVGQDRHGRRHRHPLAYRRRQREHGAPAAARTARAARDEHPIADVGISTVETGWLYAEMGFTTVVEPAVLAALCAAGPSRTRAIRRSSTRRSSAVLGNEDFLLGLLRQGESADGVRRLCRAATLADLARDRHQGDQCRRRRGVQGERRADSRSTTWCRAMASHRGRSSGRLQHAVHDLGMPHPLHLHCNNLGLARQRRDRARHHRGRAKACRCISRICSSMPTAQEGKSGFSSAAPRARRGGERDAERHRRRRPGDVRPDRDDLLGRAAPVQRARSGAAAASGSIFDGDGQWRRHRALPLSRERFLQRRAMGGRAGAVPADQRSLARVLHHRPSQRRAFHDLSRTCSRC